MNRTLKIIFIALVFLLAIVIIGIGINFIVIKNSLDSEEYNIGNDTIKSIKAVVESRKITSATTEKKNEVITKKLEYKSDKVKEDLSKYTEYLTNEAGFVLKKEINLDESPSSIELSKDSVDKGKVIMLIIEYDSQGYVINIQKGEKILDIQ